MQKGSRLRFRKRVYVVLALVMILFVFSVFTWISRPLKTETVDVNFLVGSSIGFYVETDMLHFGRLTPGGTSTRNLIIENDYDAPVQAKILVSKNLVGFVFAEEAYVISPKETVKIPITLRIPGTMDFGNYTGQIKVEFYKA